MRIFSSSVRLLIAFWFLPSQIKSAVFNFWHRITNQIQIFKKGRTQEAKSHVRRIFVMVSGSRFLDERPDYDYGGHMNLRFYEPKDGVEALCRGVDLSGNVINTIRAVKHGEQIVIEQTDVLHETGLEIYRNGEVLREKFTDQKQTIRML